MPTTDAALQKQREKVEAKREKLRAAALDREEAEASLENDITMALLKEEEHKLDQELAIQADSTKIAKDRVSAVASGQNAALGAPVVEAPVAQDSTEGVK